MTNKIDDVIQLTILKQLPWQRQHSIPFIALALIVAAFAIPSNVLALTNVLNTFDLQPTLVKSGEVWRVFTAHLVHSNLNHAGLNVLGLIGIWALHGEYYQWQKLLTIFATSTLLISACLIFNNTYDSYVGLSAVLHALFAYGALQDIKNREKTGWILLLGLLAKTAYEQIKGGSADIAHLIGVSVATDAHLYGVAIGIFIAARELLLENQQTER